MSELNLRGVPVHFPYEPYSIQIDYMEKVIESLQGSVHAVLESPTGTGKTLSLLCASLGWLVVEKHKYTGLQSSLQDGTLNLPLSAPEPGTSSGLPLSWRPPKIIYASRTHSQLTQVMRELKQTMYKHNVKCAIIGSRDQLCLKKDVLRETSSVVQANLCRSLINGSQCSFYHGVDRQKNAVLAESGVMDIEDLGNLGRKRHFCPYYMAKSLKQTADIILMPYNYLLDATARRAYGIDVNNTAIILDEAHNVEKMCEETASVQITSTDIAMAIQELTHVMKKMEQDENMMVEGDMAKDFTIDDLMQSKEVILAFEKIVDGVAIKSADGQTFPGEYVYTLFQEAGIIDNVLVRLVSVLDRLLQYLSTSKLSVFNRTGQYLRRFKDLLTMIYANSADSVRAKAGKCFKVHFQEEVVQTGGKTKTGGWQSKLDQRKQKVINYWCFSPSFGIEGLINQGIRNIIFTSGTLAPLQPLITELGIDVPVRLENPHIVSSKQILVKIVSNGVSNVLLTSSYRNRQNENYVNSLGKTIKVFANIIPDGLLVFFPSYTVLNMCMEKWQHSGIWADIDRIKAIFVEPRGKADFTSIMSKYYAQVKAPERRGACFMAVCRGKVSEGLDFADENGRGVIITGLPYPPLKDPRVVLKKQYLDENKRCENALSSQEWYNLEATRAVNQAIGRVIRHRHDYGAILLCDQRFDNVSVRNNLSAWLRPHIETTNTFQGASSGLCKFFMDARINFPTIANLSASAASLTSGKQSSESSSSAFQLPVLTTRDNPFVTNQLQCDLEVNEPETPIEEEYKLNLFPTKCSKRNFDLSMLENYEETETINVNHPVPTDRSVQYRPPHATKKRKFNVIPNGCAESCLPTPKSSVQTVRQIIEAIPAASVPMIYTAVTTYKQTNDIHHLINSLHTIYKPVTNSKDYFKDMSEFIRPEHVERFQEYIAKRAKWNTLLDEQKTEASYNSLL